MKNHKRTKQLTCPYCGYYPAISFLGKLYIGTYPWVPTRCKNCNKRLWTNIWFELLKIFSVVIVGIWVMNTLDHNFPLLREKLPGWVNMVFIIVYIIWYVLIFGYISLYHIPLQKHYDEKD